MQFALIHVPSSKELAADQIMIYIRLKLMTIGVSHVTITFFDNLYSQLVQEEKFKALWSLKFRLAVAVSFGKDEAAASWF